MANVIQEALVNREDDDDITNQCYNAYGMASFISLLQDPIIDDSNYYYDR